MTKNQLHAHNCGRTGRQNVIVANCRMDCPCWCHAELVFCKNCGFHSDVHYAMNASRNKPCYEFVPDTMRNPRPRARKKETTTK